MKSNSVSDKRSFQKSGHDNRKNSRKTLVRGEKRKTTEKGMTSMPDTADVEIEFKHREKKLEPDKKYKFKCDGVITREVKRLRNKARKTMDKEIKYRAEFSGNVEEFLYPSLRPNVHEVQSQNTNQPVDFAESDQDKDKPVIDFNLHWKVNVEDKPEKLLEDTSTTHISDKGENTLREILRLKYHERITKEKKAREAMKTPKDVVDAAKSSRKKNVLFSNIQGEENMGNNNTTPDSLYYSMVSKSKAGKLSKSIKKNLSTSALERIHDEKCEALARVLPGSQLDPHADRHLAGLMYYQIKKELSERKVNTMMTSTTSARLVHSASQADVFEEEYSDSDQASDKYFSSKSRIVRCVSSIQDRGEKFRTHRGVSQDCIDDIDEEKTIESLRAMTQLKNTSDQDYSCNSMQRLRRAHYSEVIGNVVGDITDYDGHRPTLEVKKRIAQDMLLHQQLSRGVIPEQLLRKIPRMGDLISLDLSLYGIGDDLCLCLGKSLSVLEMLHTLGLRGNRLTHKSLAVVFEHVPLRALRHLDVSSNNVAGPSMKMLCKKLASSACKLSSLELVKTCITYDDVRHLMAAIMAHETSWLMELSLAQNKLGFEAMREIVELLKYEGCALSWLDLSWNEFNARSGEVLAEALSSNKTVTSLDMSSNALRDEGGQHLAACLLSNKCLQELYLSLNNIGGKSCFIFSKVLRRHPSMKRLNLSDNPLTEAGARSIFRTILKGLRCFVMMQSCTFNSETGLFKHSNPSLDSPYSLDLSKPYEVSILSELINMVNDTTNQCTFRHISYKASEKDKSIDIVSEFVDGETYLRCGSYPWGIPSTGVLTVHFFHQLSMPQPDMAIDELAFNTILAIVVNARSEKDRKNWLFLMCMDAHFTTAQAQDLIDILDDRKLLGPGGISVVEFFRCIWSNIIDTENVYDFMYHNLDDNERVSLMHLLSFEKFKFNWINPTGHWRLDLQNRIQRSVMMQLIAVNIVESKASKKSKRGDTSQNGNWCNFRNEKLDGNQCAIDMDFSKTLPWRGILEFDYVSTTRPHPNVEEISDDDFGDLIHKLDLTTRRRCDISMSAMKLLELQLAVTNYYFSSNRVINILDCFSEDDLTQARVVIVLFCRITDLYNLDQVFRHLSAAATQDIFERLGVLNCINPLKPTHNLKLNMRYMDCRILAHTFLSMSSLENGDQLKQHPRSDVDIIVMYSQLGRVIADEHTNDNYLMFTYCEIGERQSEVAWNYRKEQCSKFLVGTKPWDTKMFKIIRMYKEIVAAKALMMGPIDLQYKAFIQQKNAKRIRNGMKNMSIVNKLKSETASNRNREGSEEESNYDSISEGMFSSIEDNSKLLEMSTVDGGTSVGSISPSTGYQSSVSSFTK